MEFGRRLALVALPLALVATSCGGAKFRYVNNSQSGLFFKVPKTWGYYRLTESDTKDRIVGESDSVSIWHVAFDAATDPSLDHLQSLSPTSPVGEVQVLALGSSLTKTVSEASLRHTQFPVDFDPAYPPQEMSTRIERLTFQRIVTKRGLHGSRVAFNIRPIAETNDWITFDGVSLFDPATQAVYFITVHCTSSCYKDNMKTVDEIISSWTVNR
jgi:hypothetical protein